MRAEVERTVCALSGYCAATSPELFELGEEQVEVLHDPIPAELRDSAIDAEAICPTAAIRLVDF